ncbi:DUF2529 family protein [Fervidibacillus halotolerans]|uniref:DUF2529 domain-containing protein n=1 Tax=Fervidibacillus halotolerans TaxID=2980027 RepID=A0A9E8LZ21_9BACI|nr:DUF2529 family protein [Fervidibacillus halotolerans]WAA12199.1 DUF2529 domain-containing protein [Fervidibacillus halotolerans]
MEKIFTTQLIGKLKKIEQEEQDAVEDGARLLSQALVGDGNVYIYAQQEMTGIFHVAAFGEEPLQRVKSLSNETIDEISSSDRGILFSKTADDEQLLHIARILRKKHVPFAVVCSTHEKEHEIEDLADVLINLHIDQGLVPTFDGKRVGYPHTIAALFVYHHMKLLIDEMLEDYE